MMVGSSTTCLWHYLCARLRALLTLSALPSKETSCSLRSSLAGWHRCRSETPSSSPLPRRLSPRCRATKDYWRTQMVDSVMADDDKVAPIYKHEDIYELLCAPASSRRSPTSSTRASMGRSPRQAEKGILIVQIQDSS